ncbi:MAG: Nif3-like dinuclear metal center hexameric protein [Oscillospiraceae bacterium]|nr:Nif3-like dinuclear metal center hexameric protein [Oscillospiraceae bacterium]
MASVHDIEQALYELAPRELAAEWDNVGLLAGRRDRAVHKVLVSLDVTAAVAEEARQWGAELIAAHHPVIFHPVKRVTDQDPAGEILLRLAEHGIAAVCMHTNLDAAQGGVNDALAAALQLEEVAPLEGGGGIARTGRLPRPVSVPDFLCAVQEALGAGGLRCTDGAKPISRVAVGGGACGEFLWAAAAAGCDAFVTADVKYNQFLDAAALRLTLVDAGHFPTEDVVCPVLARHLSERFPELAVRKSASHREVVQYYM